MIGKKIKDIRLSQGKTQTAFAAELGIEQSALSYIENGHVGPSLAVIVGVVKKYKVSYEWLLEDEIQAATSGDTLQNAVDVPEWARLLARNIETIMVEEKLEDVGFGLRCGLPAKRIHEIRKCKSPPHAGEVMQILQAFGEYSANWLLMDRGAMKIDTSGLQMDEILRRNRELMTLLQTNIDKMNEKKPQRNSG